MSTPPQPKERLVAADTRTPAVPYTGRLDEPRLWAPDDDFASARMLGTAMLIAVVGYTAIGVRLWRRRRVRRR